MSEDAQSLDEMSGRVLSHTIEQMGGSLREGQQEMVAHIAQSIDERGHLMVQAGTGTGKSVGYLVPLLTHSALSGRRNLVSTATLALQRQVLTKDAPVVVDAVAACTGIRPKVAVLKGWSNYVCLHRISGGYPTEGTLFDVALDDDAQEGLASEMGREILRVRQWASETDSGDRDDLVPGVSDRVWHYASVSKRECLGKSCPLIDECFAQLARQSALDADLVVTNHSLFGIHTTAESDLFGEVDAVVIDEAHELADRVRDQAACELSQSMVLRVARALRTHANVPSEALEQTAALLGAALSPVEDGLLMQRPPALVDAMRQVDDEARRASSSIQQSEADAAAKLLARGALDELMAALDAWSREAERSITWVSRLDGQGTERLVIAPLDVALALGTAGFGERPAVLTSATLALGGSFDAMARECGFMVSDTPWQGIDVGSPFNPAKQGIFYIAEHLPDPSPSGPSLEALDELVELAQASSGGMLGLFSSWRAAEAGAQALRERTDLEVLFQGEETISALVARFRKSRNSCLIGTMSLWQGVDVVGDACRLVVIDRIPFPHPDNPVAKARAIDANRRGFSGFQAVSLTHAALLMAQGAGRLLRSSQDRGVVAVLDRRLLTKSYGAYIRSSMPSLWPTTDPQVVRDALGRLSQDC
ncbi:ATP-dependent DNA helicase [Schaalia vaccimaxillae]|uniref:ATP-dependent DNA helicase n=1 Tax=Schaalia vaccimaxillae TaxID=183916 RepID=UPI0003B44E1D|nr:ATP-dependent DNA helicase [Schaalia vaccimaxillae]